MDKPIFLYIDDEKDASVDAIIDGFNDLGIIEVKLFIVGKNKSFDSIKTSLQNECFNGLILDLKLDGNGPNKLNFRAPTLAQDIRTLSAAEGNVKAYPIILCSTEQKMHATYDVDRSSHDLFDYKFLKGVKPNWEKLSKKLYSLAAGYEWLNSAEPNIRGVLNRVQFDSLDPRMLEKFESSDDYAQAFDYASFVIKDLFNHPEPLIKERTLAARLGIDLDSSGDSWNRLIEKVFSKAKYKGLFCDGWERWWFDLVETIFFGLSEGVHLSTIDARQRVELIIDHTGVEGLIVAKPLPYCYSTHFWVICEGHKKPLDPLEGFQIYESVDLKAWQNPKYISFDAAANRIGRDKGLRPLQSEEARIQLMKSSL